MGLTITFDCFQGSYHTFHFWRTYLAAQIGLPYNLMEGFYSEDEEWSVESLPKNMTLDTKKAILERLPLDWMIFDDDLLHIILNHSDCDGIIRIDECIALKARLEEILPAVDIADDEERENFIRITTQFIKGLGNAIEAQSIVEFG